MEGAEAIEKQVKKTEINEQGEIAKETSTQQEPKVATALPTGVISETVNIKDDVTGNRTIISLSTGGGPQLNEIVTEANLGLNKADIVTLVPSKTNEFYCNENFGRGDLIDKPYAEKMYSVNMRPMAIDNSPFKEDPPSIEDIQPITGFNKALQHENAYIYTFNVPERYKKVDEIHEMETLTGACSTQTIPALAILKNNLLGLPASTAEYPVIASPNPACAASYLHAVQHRVSKEGAIDLRFNMTATRKHQLRETYILGRIWIPLTHMTIFWDLAPDNYDAAQPILYPAFTEIGKVTLDTRKELTSLVQNMRFVDRTFPPDIEQSLIRIMQLVGNTKLSLARLYWRIWTVIAETTFMEGRNKLWKVRNIQHKHNIVHLNGPTVLKGLFSEAEMGIEPFFVTHAMLDANRGLPLKDLLFFLLSENFQAECAYGVTQNWPSLGDVKLVLPSDMDNIGSQSRNLTINSSDLYRLLEYFATTLGQQTLIDEIGRTVCQFLMRPEGDEAWLGHRSFSIQLPLFRCRRSLHFAWAMQGYELRYKFKTPPHYKLVWIGCIRYMQIALAANTVFNEIGVYSALQMEATGIHLPREWYDELSRIFRGAQRGPELNELIQRVSLRCDWGCILNKITSSISVVNPKMSNLTRVSQWSEWLLFQRMLPEGTWIAGQMGHIRAKTVIKPGRSYNPTLCGIDSGINDIYYRMVVQNISKIKIHVSSLAQGQFHVRDALTLSTCTGLPLDGQFRYIGAADDVHAYYQFVPQYLEECHIMMHEWHERTEFHWQLHAPKKYFHTGFGKQGGELILDSRINPPRGNEFQAMMHEGVHEFDPVKLNKMRTTYSSQVIQYGNPSDNASDDDEDGPSEDLQLVGPVTEQDVLQQVYPIHYCEEEKKPSVGSRILKYGMVRKKVWGGVSMLSTEELYSLSQECETEVPYLLYKPPSVTQLRMEWTRSPGKKTRERKKKQQQQEQADERRRREEIAIQQKQKTKELESVVRMREADEKLKKANQSTEIIKPVEVKKRKSEFYGWTSSQNIDTECMNSIDIWKMLDGMEDVCLSAPGSKLALQNRYINILNKLDSVDVLTLLRQVPLMARAEFCRCMYNILGDCTQFLGLSSHDRNVHDQLTRFFGAAMDNLAHNGALTDTELQMTLDNKHAKMVDWKVVGSMDSMDYLMLLLDLSSAVPDQTEEQNDGRSQTGDSTVVTKQRLTQQVATDPEFIIKEEQDRVIDKEATEQTENFQCAQVSCSVQSPSESTALHVPDGVAKAMDEHRARRAAKKNKKQRGRKTESSPSPSSSSSDSSLISVRSSQPPAKVTPKIMKRAHPMITRAMADVRAQEQLPIELPSGSAVASSEGFKSVVSQSSGTASSAVFEKMDH